MQLKSAACKNQHHCYFQLCSDFSQTSRNFDFKTNRYAMYVCKNINIHVHILTEQLQWISGGKKEHVFLKRKKGSKEIKKATRTAFVSQFLLTNRHNVAGDHVAKSCKDFSKEVHYSLASQTKKNIRLIWTQRGSFSNVRVSSKLEGFGLNSQSPSSCLHLKHIFLPPAQNADMV